MLGDYACAASNKHGSSSAKIQVTKIMLMMMRIRMMLLGYVVEDDGKF